MSDKKQYKVLHPINFGGRRERGDIVEMKEDDAKAFGGQYLEAITESESDNDEVETGDKTRGSGEQTEDGEQTGNDAGGDTADGGENTPDNTDSQEGEVETGDKENK